MKRFLPLLTLLMLAASAASAADCDRACLKNMMTSYLNALVAHDPGKAPIAANARFTEDSRDLKLGEGFWQTATKVGDYRQDFIDVQQQMVLSHVTMDTATGVALFTARLKVADNKITEIETLVSQRNGALTNFVVRPGMGIEPPKNQKNTRAELIAAADHYPRGLTVGSFVTVDAPFATGAFRIENGAVMAGEGCGRGGPGGLKGKAPGEAKGKAPAPGKGVSAKSPQDVAGCANIKTQGIIPHPDLTKSLAVVDEEQGAVVIWMNFGNTGSYGAGNALVMFEAFKVYGGQIHAVQAFMKTMPEATKRGWGTTKGGKE